MLRAWRRAISCCGKVAVARGKCGLGKVANIDWQEISAFEIKNATIRLGEEITPSASCIVVQSVARRLWRKCGKDEVCQLDTGRDPRHVPGTRGVAQCGRWGAGAAAQRARRINGNRREDKVLCDRGMPTWQAIDGNGDGEISQIEFIKALRRDKNLAVSCAAACLAFFLSAPCVCAGWPGSFLG